MLCLSQMVPLSTIRQATNDWAVPHADMGGLTQPCKSKAQGNENLLKSRTENYAVALT